MLVIARGLRDFARHREQEGEGGEGDPPEQGVLRAAPVAGEVPYQDRQGEEREDAQVAREVQTERHEVEAPVGLVLGEDRAEVRLVAIAEVDGIEPRRHIRGEEHEGRDEHARPPEQTEARPTAGALRPFRRVARVLAVRCTSGHRPRPVARPHRPQGNQPQQHRPADEELHIPAHVQPHAEPCEPLPAAVVGAFEIAHQVQHRQQEDEAGEGLRPADGARAADRQRHDGHERGGDEGATRQLRGGRARGCAAAAGGRGPRNSTRGEPPRDEEHQQAVQRAEERQREGQRHFRDREAQGLQRADVDVIHDEQRVAVVPTQDVGEGVLGRVGRERRELRAGDDEV